MARVDCDAGRSAGELEISLHPANVGPGDEAEVLEDSSLEGIFGSGRFQNLVPQPCHAAIGSHHFRNAGLRSAAHKSVAQFAHYSFGGRPMDVGIGAVEIAQRLLEAAVAGFKYEPSVAGRVQLTAK